MRPLSLLPDGSLHIAYLCIAILKENIADTIGPVSVCQMGYWHSLCHSGGMKKTSDVLLICMGTKPA